VNLLPAMRMQHIPRHTAGAAKAAEVYSLTEHMMSCLLCILHSAAALSTRLRRGPSGRRAVVALSLTDDVNLRSYNWARVQLGIPLPPMQR
jgi:hypothetical protein